MVSKEKIENKPLDDINTNRKKLKQNIKKLLMRLLIHEKTLKTIKLSGSVSRISSNAKSKRELEVNTYQKKLGLFFWRNYNINSILISIIIHSKFINSTEIIAEIIDVELTLKWGDTLTKQVKLIIIEIVWHRRIPNKWRISKTIILFQKGGKEVSAIDKGMNLLSTTLKLSTKSSCNKINYYTSVADEQM